MGGSGHDGQEASQAERRAATAEIGTPGFRLLVLAVAVVVTLGLTAVAVTVADPGRLGFVPSAGGSTADGPAVPGGAGAAGRAGERSLAAPLGGRSRGTFELVDGVTRLELRLADLAGDLYRVAVPGDAEVTPRVEVLGERVRLHLAPAEGTAPGQAEVLLNSRVGWRLRLVGGVREQVLDLSSGRVTGVALVGGAARTELLLPALDGTVTVRMTGGVNQFTVRTTGRPPVRVRVGAGAGSVGVYDVRDDGVPAGTLLGAPDWDRAVDRLYLDLVGGAHTVTVADG